MRYIVNHDTLGNVCITYIVVSCYNIMPSHLPRNRNLSFKMFRLITLSIWPFLVVTISAKYICQLQNKCQLSR